MLFLRLSRFDATLFVVFFTNLLIFLPGLIYLAALAVK